ncbi:MAG: hemolysin D [Pseudomonadota bacterium]|nr:hemolysin D [Pseudomonadota bacterium]
METRSNNSRQACSSPRRQPDRARRGAVREISIRPLPTLAALAVALVLAGSHAVTPVAAHTQSGAGTAMGNGIPMGHEWVTRLAALEVLGGDPIMPPDPNDPRRQWTQGLAKNTSLDGAGAEVARLRSQPYADQRYQSTYKAVYDAIVGERWVDIGGFNATTSRLSPVNCWDAVAQEAVEVQYDHFMRRFDDVGAQGGVDAAKRSTQRFIDYFVAAATAPSMNMVVWDGGGYSAKTEVDRNYFLLGRAAHLFQDSFSSEHTVRLPADNHTSIRQVKSYLCAPGSEQHTHALSAIFDFTSGDVIWNTGTQLESGWGAYRPSNMKSAPLVATEATKDLWAAFIRTMAQPMGQREETARREATTLAVNWLSFDEKEMLGWYEQFGNRDRTYVLAAGQSGPGQTVEACMKGLGYKSGTQAEAVDKFKSDQRMCLYNVVAVEGYSDLFDTSMHMPFNWAWRALTWQTPPSNWQIPQRPADTGQPVRVRHSNGNYMTAPDGLAKDNWVYVRSGVAPLDLVQVPTGDASSFHYRSRLAPSLFLSYRASTGAVKLYDSANQAAFTPRDGGLMSNHWNMWVWLYNDSPYITRTGNPANANARWSVERQP